MSARGLARFTSGLLIAVLLTVAGTNVPAATIVVDPDTVPQATYSSALLPDVLLTPSDPTLHVVFAETKSVYVYEYGFITTPRNQFPWKDITVIDHWLTDPLGDKIPYSALSDYAPTPYLTHRSGLEYPLPGPLTGAVHFVFDLQEATTIDVIVLGNVDLPSVPIPPAIYLFGSVILGLLGTSRFKKRFWLGSG